MGQKFNQTIGYEVGTVDKWSKALIFERENKRESKDPRFAPPRPRLGNLKKNFRLLAFVTTYRSWVQTSVTLSKTYFVTIIIFKGKI